MCAVFTTRLATSNSRVLVGKFCHCFCYCRRSLCAATTEWWLWAVQCAAANMLMFFSISVVLLQATQRKLAGSANWWPLGLAKLSKGIIMQFCAFYPLGTTMQAASSGRLALVASHFGRSKPNTNPNERKPKPVSPFGALATKRSNETRDKRTSGTEQAARKSTGWLANANSAAAAPAAARGERMARVLKNNLNISEKLCNFRWANKRAASKKAVWLPENKVKSDPRPPWPQNDCFSLPRLSLLASQSDAMTRAPLPFVIPFFPPKRID